MKQHRIMSIIVFLTLITTRGFGQTSEIQQNHPRFYNIGDWWVEGDVEYNWMERTDNDWDFYLYKYTIDGDTVINGKQYVCVSCQQIFLRSEEAFAEPSLANTRFFIREDEVGRQYVWIPKKEEECLMWDFSTPFEVGAFLTYGLTDLRADKPEYTQLQMKIDEVGTYELKNGSKVKMFNNWILEGFGNPEVGIAFNLGETDWEDLNSLLLMRYCKGELVLQNDLLLETLNRVTGTNVVQQLTDNILCKHPLQIDNTKQQLFDLQGRPVTTRPTRCIYIKSGKKYYTK